MPPDAVHPPDRIHDEEIACLERRYIDGGLDDSSIVQLGNLWFNHKRNLGRAIELYREAAIDNPSPVPFFNLGLALADPEISQDLDAADAFSLALCVDHGYTPAKTQLDVTVRKLLPLAEKARAEAAVLTPASAPYQFYISPFRMLQLDEDLDSEPEPARIIQRASKSLSHNCD